MENNNLSILGDRHITVNFLTILMSSSIVIGISSSIDIGNR